MQFHDLVDELHNLSLAEKEEARALLDKLVTEERRAEISNNHLASRAEFERGELSFSSDPARLRQLLDA